MGAFPSQAGKQPGVPIDWKAAPYGTADWISVNGITRPKATFGKIRWTVAIYAPTTGSR